MNPWNLSPAQADVMDVMAATGCVNTTALRLSIGRRTVSDHLKAIRKKMGQCRTIRAVVMWDRWRRPAAQQAARVFEQRMAA